MKKLLLTAGICLSALFFAQAQQAAPTAPATAEQQTEKMILPPLHLLATLPQIR